MAVENTVQSPASASPALVSMAAQHVAALSQIEQLADEVEVLVVEPVPVPVELPVPVPVALPDPVLVLTVDIVVTLSQPLLEAACSMQVR